MLLALRRLAQERLAQERLAQLARELYLPVGEMRQARDAHSLLLR